MIRAIRNSFSRHYEAIKLGLLVGLLVANVFLLSQQANTLREVLSISDTIKQQIKEDNDAHIESRKDSENRNTLIINYLRCIALIPYGERTTESVDLCLKNNTIPKNLSEGVSSSSTPADITASIRTLPFVMPITEASQVIQRTNEPTTSAPPNDAVNPQHQQTGLIQGVLNNVNHIVKDVL